MKNFLKSLKLYTNIRTTIRKRLFAYFLLILIPSVVLLGTVTYLVSTHTMKSYIMQSSAQIVDQVNLHLDLNINNLKRDTLTIMGNQSIVDFLMLDPTNLYDIYIQSNHIKENLFNLLTYNRDDLDGIFLLGKNGLFLSTGTRVEKYSIFNGEQVLGELDWLSQLPADGTLLLTGVHEQGYASGVPVVTLARRIVNPQNPSTTLGFFWIDLNLGQLEKNLNQVTLGDTGFLAIFDQLGQPLVLPKDHRNHLELFREVGTGQETHVLRRVEGQEKIITVRRSRETGWQIAAVVPFEEVAGGIISTKYATAALALGCILIALFFSVRFAGSITRPIERLEERMWEASKGYLDGEIPVENTDEVGRLTHNFNQMLQRIQNLIQDMYQSRVRRLEAESKQQQAELKALQAQINPHFLFNTLNIINSMAVLEGMDTISEMVVTLGDFFRYNMKTDELIVSLKEEISQVERYMIIQHLRFGDRLALEVDVPVEYYSQGIIKLTLQPLVENACIHGLELKRGKRGRIKIGAMRKNDYLIVTVQDNGKGMAPEIVERYNQYFATKGDQGLEGHIGMVNVFSRLRLHYGERAGMYISSTVDEGTLIQITLPYQSVTQIDGGYENII